MFKGQNAEMISKKSMGRSLPQCLHCKTRSLSQNISIQTADAHYNKKINHKLHILPPTMKIFFILEHRCMCDSKLVCVIHNCRSSDHCKTVSQPWERGPLDPPGHFQTNTSNTVRQIQLKHYWTNTLDAVWQMRLTLLDKYIQHSAKQNSFTALREWTSLPSRPSHDSTTCTSWSEAFPTLTACGITDCSWVWVCVFLYCCFMFVC